MAGLISPARGRPTWTWQIQGPPGAPAVLLLHGWMATAHSTGTGRSSSLDGRSRGGAGPPRSWPGGPRGSPFHRRGLRRRPGRPDRRALDKPSHRRRLLDGRRDSSGAGQAPPRRSAGDLVLCATAASFARRVKLRPAVWVAGHVGGAAARIWPGAAHRFLTWRIARHDMKVERQRRWRPEDHGYQASQVLDVAGEGIAFDRASSANRQGPMEWALAERSMSDLAAFIEAGAALNAYDSSRWLPQLDVPTAVLVTTGDTVVAPWRQEAMAALIPGARIYLVDGGHDAVVAQPDLFLPILRDACAELAQRGHNPERRAPETVRAQPDWRASLSGEPSTPPGPPPPPERHNAPPASV